MNLKEMGKLSGLKQYKIAEFLGITRQQYNNIEKGKSKIDSDKLEKLSHVFKRDAVEILRAWEESKNGKA